MTARRESYVLADPVADRIAAALGRPLRPFAPYQPERHYIQAASDKEAGVLAAAVPYLWREHPWSRWLAVTHRGLLLLDRRLAELALVPWSWDGEMGEPVFYERRRARVHHDCAGGCAAAGEPSPGIAPGELYQEVRFGGSSRWSRMRLCAGCWEEAERIEDTGLCVDGVALEQIAELATSHFGRVYVAGRWREPEEAAIVRPLADLAAGRHPRLEAAS